MYKYIYDYHKVSNQISTEIDVTVFSYQLSDLFIDTTGIH